MLFKNCYPKKLAFIGLFFFSVSVFSQENKLIDSLKHKLKQNINTDEKLKVYGDLIWSYKEKSIDSSLNYIVKALKIEKLSNNKNLKSQLFSDIAGVYMIKGDFNECLKMYWKSLSIRKEQKDTIGIGKIKANLTAVYTKYDRLDSAMINGIEAMKIFEKKGYVGYANVLKSNVATIYESIKNYQKALDYNFEVLEYSKKTKNDNLTGKLYGNIATNYYYLNDTLNAEKFYLKSIEISKKNKNNYSLGASLNNLSGIYFEKNQIKKGIATAEEALKYRSYLNSELDIANLYFALGKEYFNQQKFKKSQSFFNKSIVVFEKSQNLNKLANNYNFLSILAAKNNDAKSMILYRKKSDAVFERYASAKNSKEITELEIKYQTEKKEKELLQTKTDKATTELKLNNQKQLTYGLIGGVILLFLGGFSIFQRNKRKHQLAIAKQKEENLQSVLNAEENERTRIARELHDGVVQQIGSVILKSRNVFSKLELTENKETQQIVSDLENSSNDLRTISHQMMPRALEELGLIAALEDLLKNSLQQSSINYNFEHFNIDKRLPKKIETALYRISQELINNIIKHSKATEVFIQLYKTNNNIMYLVEDNGIGLSNSKTKGIGLSNISSRLNIINGSVNFDSKKGTLATIKIPL